VLSRLNDDTFFKKKSKYLDVALSELVGNKQEVRDYLGKFYPDRPADELLDDWRGRLVKEMK